MLAVISLDTNVQRNGFQPWVETFELTQLWLSKSPICHIFQQNTLEQSVSISRLNTWPRLYVTCARIFSTGWTILCNVNMSEGPLLFELCFELLLTSWLLASLPDECRPPASFPAFFAWNFIRVQHTEPECSHNLAAAPRSLHCRSLRAGVQRLWNLQLLLEICQSFSQHREMRNNTAVLCSVARNRITSAEDRWSGQFGFWRCEYSDHLLRISTAGIWNQKLPLDVEIWTFFCLPTCVYTFCLVSYSWQKRWAFFMWNCQLVQTVFLCFLRSWDCGGYYETFQVVTVFVFFHL